MTIACSGESSETLNQSRAPVVGGQPTAPGEYPATGALLGSYQGELFALCTGTLIARDVVVTAAHCLTPNPKVEGMPSFTLVRDIDSVSSDEVHAALETAIHPDFDPTTAPVGQLGRTNDIGIVRLASPVPEDAALAILPSPEEGAALAPGMGVAIVGYGITIPDMEDYGVKHDAETIIAALGDWEIVIGGSGGPQNCGGDSGGPAFANLGAGPRLVGIVSHGIAGGGSSCDKGGIDTRVDAFLDWLHTRASVPCGSGKSLPCPPETELEPDASTLDTADAGAVSGSDAGASARASVGSASSCALRGRSGQPGSVLAVAALILLATGRRRRRTRGAARPDRSGQYRSWLASVG
jgi:hypothetical protein